MSSTAVHGDAPPYAPAAIETISPEDFETASVRSAAPSYTSDAPSYHSTVPNAEPVPPYSPPERPRTTSTNSLAPLISSDPNSSPRQGLPPVPTGPLPQRTTIPSLNQFRIPSWSTISANPTYHRVALRRVAAASRENHLDGIRRVMLDRIEEEEQRNRVRPLEDPYLVGEAAAAQARRERLARENGDEILIREDRRWDFFLAQMKDREERQKKSSWKRFRLGNGTVGRLAQVGAR